jgi:ABC-2 type transport system ATP-binding protein
MNALETTGLAFRYRRGWALRDCTLAAPAGRVVGLIGPNGAGKTTLLHLAVGLLRPAAGTVCVLGAGPRDALARGQVGFVAQDKPLYCGFTVADMLMFSERMNPGWDKELALSRLCRYGIPLRRRVGHLSGGQQAQVALTVAVGKRPKVLLLDEPVATLDPLARREFLQALMEEVADSGLTVVLSSHLISDLDRVCDYVILLRDSRVQVTGATDELVAQHRLLTGPRGSAEAIARSHTVISAAYTDRQASLIIRCGGPVRDPAWTARELTLEDFRPHPGHGCGRAAGAHRPSHGRHHRRIPRHAVRVQLVGTALPVPRQADPLRLQHRQPAGRSRGLDPHEQMGFRQRPSAPDRDGRQRLPQIQDA